MTGMAGAMDATYWDANIAWRKVKQFVEPILRPIWPLTAKLHQNSYLIYCMSRVCTASTTKHLTKLWYCDITRRSNIVTEQERLQAISTGPLDLLTL